MEVSRIGYQRNNIQFGKKREYTPEEKKMIMDSSPVACGVAEGLLYGVGGFLLERGLAKLTKWFDMGLKKSLILNGAIGLVSAIATGINLAVLKKRFSKEQSQVQVNK